MNALGIILRILGGSIIMVALLHVLLGPGADVLLGAKVSDISLSDPTIDSQNRFYGAAFALYGVVLIFCASDIRAHRSILLWALLVFFLAGLARFISVVYVGWPPLMVILLLVVELVAPPVLALWVQKETSQ